MEVYEETWKWLAERNCAQLIPAQILEQYAMAISRWIQCEECITEYGFLAKHPTTGNAIPSPYVAMSQSFSKQANNLWYQIYQSCAKTAPWNTGRDAPRRHDGAPAHRKAAEVDMNIQNIP